MALPRIGILLVAACCAFACGDRPDPPGPAVSSGDPPSGDESNGAGSASGGLDRPADDEDDVVSDDTDEPAPPSDEPGAGASTDAGVAPPASPAEDDPPAPGSSGQAAFGCTEDGGGCLIFNIAVADTVADTCIQLALDNCESSPQPGLRVELPVSWRLGAASVSRTSDNCVPDAPYNPMTTSAIVAATGSIGWNEDTRFPSEVVLDVTLQPASTAANGAPIQLANSDIVDAVLECD